MIKFDPLNKPSFVVQDFLLDDKSTGQQIIGYYIIISNQHIRIEAGDFIDDDGDVYKVYKAADYNASDFIKDIIHEKLGKDVVRDLYRTLRSQNLTQAQEGDLIGRVYPVLGSLGDGFIRGARVIANNIAVAGQLTQPRKDFILAKIDEAITKL